jgi:hypothetical protein
MAVFLPLPRYESSLDKLIHVTNSVEFCKMEHQEQTFNGLENRQQQG